jgi:hypothetical protein
VPASRVNRARVKAAANARRVIADPRYALMHEIAKLQKEWRAAHDDEERLKPIAERWETQLRSASYRAYQINEKIEGFKAGLEVLLKVSPLNQEVVERWADEIAKEIEGDA